MQNLIPPIRKHTYALDVEPSTLISDEAVFQALSGIDWATIDFQPLGGEEEDEPAQEIHNLQVSLVKIHDPEAGLVSAYCHTCDKQFSFWASKRLVIG